MSHDELETEHYAELTAGPLVMRDPQPGRPPFTRADAWASIAFFMGHWQMRGYGHRAVEEKGSGRMIGRENTPPMKVGERLGEKRGGTCRINDIDVLVYGVDRP